MSAWVQILGDRSAAAWARMLGLERVLSYKREQSFLQVYRHDGIQQKGQNLLCTMLWLLFGQRLQLKKAFPFHMIFTFYWDISAPTGEKEYKSDLISIKSYNFKLYENPECCCHQDLLTFSAKKTPNRAPFPQGDQAFAGGTSHVSQWSSHECHTASTLTQSPLTPSPLAQSLLPGLPQLLWLRRMQRSEITVLSFQEWPADGNNQIKPVRLFPPQWGGKKSN